jgi:hypothetical protein
MNATIRISNYKMNAFQGSRVWRVPNLLVLVFETVPLTVLLHHHHLSTSARAPVCCSIAEKMAKVSAKCWVLMVIFIIQISVESRTIVHSHLPSIHRVPREKIGARSHTAFKNKKLELVSSRQQVVFHVRGGADSNKKSIGGTISSAINNITPTTRVYLMGCLMMAALTLLGVPEVCGSS